jgi:hypothetical protein
MPRLSLFKPEKGFDYKFIDRQASEMFQVGGTDVYLHKYMGPKNPTSGTGDQPVYATQNVANIQDLLFLENRDRAYDSQIYRIRGIYNVQNVDFNLSQFGLFIDNDTLYMTVHINDFIHYIGRKPISGDVIELPHLRDDFALNDYDVSLPRYYVIEDVGRASEGFSATWYPHLYRLKIKKITDSQQFADIFDQPAKDANGDADASGKTLRDLLSMHGKELAINDAIVQQAEIDAPKSGYETRQFYTLAADPTTGKPLLQTADSAATLASSASTSTNVASVNSVPQRSGYTGYLLGNGFPDNGYDFGFGIQFPTSPQDNDFFLRVDFLPNRLYKFDSKSSAWIAVEDSVRMNMTNNDTRNTLKTGFINNDNYTYFDAVVANPPTTNITSDYITLAIGQSIIDTTIDPTVTGLYLVLKFETNILQFTVASYPTMLSTYTNINPLNGITSTKLRITLPIISTVQQTIPFAGQWNITFYNSRVAEKQGLSKALRPRADL